MSLSQSCAVPDFIVKYCNDYVLDRMLKGSVKFGTLSEYAASECEIGTLSDKFEGSLSVDISPGFLKDVRVGGVRITNSYVEGKIGLSYRSKLNDWAFCATKYPYEPEIHRQVVSGCNFAIGENKYFYPSNPDLRNFIIIDFRKFFTAIQKEARRHPEFRAVGEFAHFGYINYGDRLSRYSADDASNRNSNFTNQDYIQTVFVKPESFFPEREIRTILRMHTPRCAPISAGSIFFESLEIKNCMVNYGTLNM